MSDGIGSTLLVLLTLAVLTLTGSAPASDQPVCHESRVVAGSATVGVGSAIVCEVKP